MDDVGGSGRYILAVGQTSGALEELVGKLGEDAPSGVFVISIELDANAPFRKRVDLYPEGAISGNQVYVVGGQVFFDYLERGQVEGLSFRDTANGTVVVPMPGLSEVVDEHAHGLFAPEHSGCREEVAGKEAGGDQIVLAETIFQCKGFVQGIGEVVVIFDEQPATFGSVEVRSESGR